MPITRTDVEKIADLARLELTAEETDLFTEQLSSIIGYVEKLNELDTTNVPPMSHCAPAGGDVVFIIDTAAVTTNDAIVGAEIESIGVIASGNAQVTRHRVFRRPFEIRIGVEQGNGIAERPRVRRTQEDGDRSLVILRIFGGCIIDIFLFNVWQKVVHPNVQFVDASMFRKDVFDLMEIVRR